MHQKQNKTLYAWSNKLTPANKILHNHWLWWLRHLKGLVVSSNQYAPVFLPMSLIIMRKISGPRTVPCGMPLCTEDSSDFAPFATTNCFLFTKKLWIHMAMFSCVPNTFIFWQRIPMSTLSNALLKSRYIVSMFPPSYIASIMSS